MADTKIINCFGKLFDPFNLEEKDLTRIGEQLAIVLPRIPRFSGQLTPNYTVAQHCLSMVEYFGGNIEMQKVAISHELFEGLGIGDIPSPLKRRLPLVMEAEKKALQMFAKLYNIDYSLYESKEFKEADIGLLVMEALALTPTNGEFDWTTYGKPKGMLYKTMADEKTIRYDFEIVWNALFDTRLFE